MFWGGVASSVAEHYDQSLSPKPDLPLSPASKSGALTLKELNRMYELGHPSNNVRQAGLVVHMKDDTEEYGAGRLFRPGDRQFQTFWATSIVNKNMPGMYKDSCGIIIAPKAVELMCSFYQDYTSWNVGCKPEYLFKPDKLEAMLNRSLALQKGGAAVFECAADLFNHICPRLILRLTPRGAWQWTVQRGDYQQLGIPKQPPVVGCWRLLF